jgi:hypothetical protein
MNNILPLTVLVIGIALISWSGGFQGLAPVDTSAFENNEAIQASFTQLVISGCQAMDLRDHTVHHQDLSLTGTVTFQNHSAKPIFLYKHFFVSTGRIATTPQDIAAGKFVGGFDGDRMTIGHKPDHVSYGDFALIPPGESYQGTVTASIVAATSPKAGYAQIPGEYWVQLGLDVRPDEFYFDSAARESFKHKWHARGQLVDFILAKPFPIDLVLDPNTPACKG